jgi:hypothetical protein
MVNDVKGDIKSGMVVYGGLKIFEAVARGVGLIIERVFDLIIFLVSGTVLIVAKILASIFALLTGKPKPTWTVGQKLLTVMSKFGYGNPPSSEPMPETRKVQTIGSPKAQKMIEVTRNFYEKCASEEDRERFYSKVNILALEEQGIYPEQEEQNSKNTQRRNKPNLELEEYSVSDQHETRKKHQRIRCPYCGEASRVVTELGEGLQQRVCKNEHQFGYSYLMQAVSQLESNYKVR